MDLPTHFISCDWGLSNFRLRLVHTATLAVRAEHNTGAGIRKLNERFAEGEDSDRLKFYVAYLKAQLAHLPTKLSSLPIAASGMASSNIGMRDLPYGNLPIEETATTFVYQDLSLRPDQPIRLISGIKSEKGMMRGEETQALGLLERMAEAADGVLLLPGTHSKHLSFRGGRFTDFTSYMTGELFEVISRKSILAGSVTPGQWNERTGDCFRAGVLSAYESGCTPQLFAIRAGHVLRQSDPTDNFYRLSGLLIGDELRHLSLDQSHEVYLAGSGSLLHLYRFALETLGYGRRTTFYDDAALSEAMLSGQRKILLR